MSAPVEEQSSSVKSAQSGVNPILGESTVVKSPLSVDGGRRRRRGARKSNPWLAHVKETMRKNRGVSFKNVLKMAKRSFKSKSQSQSKSQSKSQSQSQSAGRRRRGGSRNGRNTSKLSQSGGSGMAGKAPFGENAAPVV
jgi:hypothetical protein